MDRRRLYLVVYTTYHPIYSIINEGCDLMLLGEEHNTKTPLYYQLKRLIKKNITQGTWGIHEKIPSERDFESMFGVSRMTVRQAITELVNEGVLIRKQGRGTFVGDLKIEQNLVDLQSFTEEMKDMGFKPSTQLIHAETIIPDATIAKEMGLELGEKIYRLERLRLADREPMALQITHVPQKICPQLLDHNLEGSFYELLQNTYHIAIKEARQSLEAGPINTREASLLHITPTDPALILKRITYDTKDRPIELVKSVYRGDTYRFVVKLTK